MNPTELRSEWSKSLPPPHSPLTEEVRNLADSCGIAIRANDLDFLCQLIFGYLGKRTDGRRILFKLLKTSGIKTQPGNYLKTYYKEGYLGMDEYKIRPDELEEMRMWLYRGEKVLPYDLIEVVDQPDRVACDDCGILSPAKYCNETVREWNNGKERLLSLCNHCRMSKEDPKVRDSASQKTCQYCPVKSCTYHPVKQEVLKEEARGPIQTAPAAAIHRPLDQTRFTPPMIEHKPQSSQERYSAI